MHQFKIDASKPVTPSALRSNPVGPRTKQSARVHDTPGSIAAPDLIDPAILAVTTPAQPTPPDSQAEEGNPSDARARSALGDPVNASGAMTEGGGTNDRFVADAFGYHQQALSPLPWQLVRADSADGASSGTSALGTPPSAMGPGLGLSLFAGSLIALTARSSPTTSAPVTIRVIDGYVAGAKIYIDTNRNGAAEDNELVAGVVTDERGDFTLPSMPTAPIIAVGGINTDTGLPNRMPILAPQGARVLTPLTTVAQFMILDGHVTTADEAAVKVISALGLNLPGGRANLLYGYDPVAANDAAVHRAGVAIATLFDIGSNGDSVIGFHAIQALTKLVIDTASSSPGATIDLYSTNTVDAVLGQGLFTSGVVAAAKAAVEQIAAARDITSIATAQKQQLDSPSAATPTLDVAEVFLTSIPTGSVRLNPPTATSTRAAAAGDTLKLTLFRGEQLLGEREETLKQDLHIDTGSITIAPPSELEDGTYRVTAQLITPRGKVSDIVEDRFTVDAVPAKALGVKLDAGGQSLNAPLPKGTKLTVLVEFDSPVKATGAPSLALQIDGQTVYAQLDASAGTPTALIFTHILLNNARDVSIPADAIRADARTLVDERGRDAVLTTDSIFPNGLLLKLDGNVLYDSNPIDLGTQAGAFKTFQAVLGAKPKSEVTLALQSGDASEAVLAATSSGTAKSGSIITLHFTPDNWNVAQNFKVVLVDDKRNDSPAFVPIFATARSQDPNFNNLSESEGPLGSAFAVRGLPMEAASVTVTLNDQTLSPDTTISLLPSGDTPAAPKTLALALSRAPIAEVTIAVSGEGDDFTIDSFSTNATHTLRFDPHNWNQPQSVVLAAATHPGLLRNNADSIQVATYSADPSFNQIQFSIAVDASDIASGGAAPHPKFGGAPQSVIELITTAVGQLIDQIASETLPLVGQAGKAFVDGLTAAIFDGNTIDFVFDQSNNTFKLKIEKTLPVFQVPLASDLGFAIGEASAPIIGFDLDATVDVSVGARLMLEGQINTLAIDSGQLDRALILRPFDAGPSNASADDAGSQLRLDLNVAVPGQMKGSLWPFTVTATDQKAVNEALARDAGTGMRGRIEVSLAENNAAPGVTIGELFAMPQNALDLRADWTGQVSAKVEGALKTGVDFFDFFLPSMSFDLGIPFLSAATSNAEQRLQALEERRSVLVTTYPGIESAAAAVNANSTPFWLTRLSPGFNAAAADELAAIDKQIPALKAQVAQSGSWAVDTGVNKVLLDNITLNLGDVFDYVTPIIQVLDPVLQTIRPVIDILTQDLLAELTVTPYKFNQDEWGFWDYVFAPVKLAREGLKAAASSALSDLITNTIKSMDGANGDTPDGQVSLLEVLGGGAKLARQLPGMTAQLSEALDSISSLIATVDKILDYLDLYYSISDRLRAPNGLVTLDHGINLGSLVISQSGLSQPPPLTGGGASASGGTTTASGSTNWVAVPPEGQKTLPLLIDLLGQLSPEAADFVEDLGDLGISFPLLSDPTLIGKVLMLQPVDLVEFRPKIPQLAAEISLPLGDVLDMVANSILPGLSTTLTAVRSIKLPGAQPVKLEAPLSIDAGISLDSRLAIGMDTAGIIDWVRKGARVDLAGAASLLDGLYLSDNLVNGVDLPELSGAFNVDLLLKLLVGGSDYGLLLSAQAGVGIHGGYELDLEDGGEQSGQADGKVRPSEIVAGLLDPGTDGELDFWDVAGSLLPGGGLYDFDVWGQGKVGLAAGFELDLANSVIRKSLNSLGDLLAFAPLVGPAVKIVSTIAGDILATVPKIELELAATNTFPIFDTRGGQPVLFA